MILTDVVSKTIDKTEVIDFYKEMLNNQTTNFWALIIFFLTITTALIGATWLWNFYYAKKQIKNEVDEQIEKIENGLKIKYEKYLKEEIGKYEESINAKLLKNESASLISFAAHCIHISNHTLAVNYYASSLKIEIERKNDSVIRYCLNCIMGILLNESVIINSEELDFRNLTEAIDNTPDTLKIEKEKILEKLDSLAAKILDQTKA